MKDAKGHGSNGRGGSPAKAAGRAKLRASLAQAAEFSKRHEELVRSGTSPMDAHNQIHNEMAASRLASGPKSAPAPVHDAMRAQADADYERRNGMLPGSEAARRGYAAGVLSHKVNP